PGPPDSAPTACRPRSGSSAARPTDARSAPRFSKGRDREVVADHQGGEHQGRVKLSIASDVTFLAERPEGADYQWRKIPLGELSIDPVADERLVRVTARTGASGQRLPWAAERSGGP